MVPAPRCPGGARTFGTDTRFAEQTGLSAAAAVRGQPWIGGQGEPGLDLNGAARRRVESGGSATRAAGCISLTAPRRRVLPPDRQPPGSLRAASGRPPGPAHAIGAEDSVRFLFLEPGAVREARPSPTTTSLRQSMSGAGWSRFGIRSPKTGLRGGGGGVVWGARDSQMAGRPRPLRCLASPRPGRQLGLTYRKLAARAARAAAPGGTYSSFLLATGHASRVPFHADLM